MKWIKLSNLTKDIFLTAIVTIVNLISIILTTRLLAQGLGPSEFGLYSLSRNVIKSIITFVTLGMTVALPRYLAFYFKNEDKQKRVIFYGYCSVLSAIAIFFLLAIIFPQMVSSLLFGNVGSHYLLLGTLFLMIGHGVHLLSYATFRGHLLMNRANVLQFINFGLLPLGVALFFNKTSAHTVLLLMGIGTIIIALLPFLNYFIKSFGAIHYIKDHAVKELFTYAIPRVPADIGLGLIFLFGPWTAARIGDIKESGFLVISQSLLILIGTILDAIGIVALPYFARLSGDTERDKLRASVFILTALAFNAGIFATFQLFIFADWITILWCGKEYIPAIPYMRITVISTGAYAIYVCLRSVIDADELKAINTKNIWISLIIGIFVSALSFIIGCGSISLAIGLASAFISLGTLSLIFIHKRFGLKMCDYNLTFSLILNLIIVVIVLIVKKFLPFSYSAVVILFFLQILFIMLFIKIFKIKGIKWFKETVKVVDPYEQK
ncbi:MAG: lipopolysaccharide biosynthesis protein [candidate division WOR-3 bacterium]